jgi:hypothetical protein
MDPTSACALDPRAVYEATIARRSTDQQRVEGAAALRLIDAATPSAQSSQVLPPGATISVRA